jgi:hypothetical protein
MKKKQGRTCGKAYQHRRNGETVMTIEERTAWTRRIVMLPPYVAHGLVVQQLLNSGDLMLAAIPSPQNAREWEFNSRVETLQAAAERFVQTKVTPVCPVKLV